MIYNYFKHSLIVMNSKLNIKENIEPLDLAESQSRSKICDEESRQIAILF